MSVTVHAALPADIQSYVDAAKDAISRGKKPAFFAFEVPEIPYYAPLLASNGTEIRGGSFLLNPSRWRWEKGLVCTYSCPHRLTLYFEDGDILALSPSYEDFEHRLQPHIQALSETLDTPFRNLETHWFREPPSGPIHIDTPFPGTTQILKTSKNHSSGSGKIALVALITVAIDIGFGKDWFETFLQELSTNWFVKFIVIWVVLGFLRSVFARVWAMFRGNRS